MALLVSIVFLAQLQGLYSIAYYDERIYFLHKSEYVAKMQKLYDVHQRNPKYSFYLDFYLTRNKCVIARLLLAIQNTSNSVDLMAYGNGLYNA